jgi:hypothetical protein
MFAGGYEKEGENRRDSKKRVRVQAACLGGAQAAAAADRRCVTSRGTAALESCATIDTDIFVAPYPSSDGSL